MRRFLCIAPLIVLAGCFTYSPSDGGGQTSFSPPRAIDPADVALPPGYTIERVSDGFTFPTAVALNEAGAIYVTESGYAYGEVFATPRLLHVGVDGSHNVVAEGANPPWTGLAYHEGEFYITEGGQQPQQGSALGGRLLRVSPEGNATVLVDDLPSLGDHHTNAPVIGDDGYVYFGQGTATNAGVVGLDNADFGWLERHPEFHDIPGETITLAGRNFTTANPLTADSNDRATTGAYLPFGTPSQPGQTIQGRVRCTGAILRVPLSGGEPELVAWGLRNPFGLAFSPDGVLYATDNGLDRRGSRPAFGGADFLWRIESGLWYGWPDFSGGRPLTDPWFAQGGTPQPQFLLSEHPNDPPAPVARFGVHSSSNGIEFSTNADFGYVGEAFIAQLGDMAPGVGKVLNPIGFKVVRVNVETGVINDFAVNKGDRNAPATKLGRGGLERPVDVAFSPDGTMLYILDFGVMTIGDDPQPREQTGVLWRVSRQS